MTAIHHDGRECVIMGQFWIKFRKQQCPVVSYKVGDSADKVARQLVNLAIDLFERDWPGARFEELHVVGITDFVNNVNADGSVKPYGR